MTGWLPQSVPPTTRRSGGAVIPCPGWDSPTSDSLAAALRTCYYSRVTAVTAHPLTGPEAIEFALSRLNLDDLEKEQRQVIADKKKTARPRAVRILGILQGLRKNEVGAEDLMLKSIPVIPPQYRPFSVTGNTFLPGAANEHYRDLLEYRRLYQKTEEAMGRAGSGEVYGDLVKAVNATYGFGDSPNPKTKAREVKGFFETITGSSPKTGYFQSKMLSKPVDTVGRGVVIPDADYDSNEIGIPAEQAWKLYGSYIQRRLVRSGMAPAAALRHVKERTPQALKALESEMGVRPVVMTRSPAWHKFNVQGANPRLVEGDAIRVNTWTTDGQNMDFDGDECINQIYACIPSSEIEKWRMSYRNLDAHEVRFPQGSSIPTMRNSRVYLFDLEDFPHDELIRSKEGEKGMIDFHKVNGSVFVLAYDEVSRELLWSKVAYWSKHYAREIEIVDTHNGYQIVTDDDPRAVYGTAAGGLEMRRFTPTEALKQKVLVPRSRLVPAPELTVTSVPGCNDGSARSTQMKERITLDHGVGWLLGAMCGDGWVCKDKGIPQRFDFSDNDGFNCRQLVSLLPLIAADKLPKVTEVICKAEEAGRYGDTVSYRFPSANMASWFRDLIGGDRDADSSGSANKHLPPFFLSASEDFRLGLFAGLMDTDGSISVSNGKADPQLMSNFASTSIRLAQETKLLAASLGIFGRITPGKTPLGKDTWILSFSNSDIHAWGGKYMVHEGKLAKLAHISEVKVSNITGRYDIVPIPERLALALRKAVGCPKITKKARHGEQTDEVESKKRTQSIYATLQQAGSPGSAKYGAISRQGAEAAIARLGEAGVADLPGGPEWLLVVRSGDVTWERVTAVQYTGIREDGYDLTVPGYETFMAADGIILSNTVSIHLPSSDAAVKDVRDRMMPDKMLWSIKDRDKPMSVPKHEQVIGLSLGAARPLKNKHTFQNHADAMKALETGQIDLNDDIDVDANYKPASTPHESPTLP